MRIITLILVFTILLFGCVVNKIRNEKLEVDSEVGNMQVTSPAFNHGEVIPDRYTCKGANTNPKLVLSDVPASTKSLAIIMDDPDAPGGTWLHWTVWNIDPKTKEIPEGAKLGVEGLTSAQNIGYHGPCPPPGYPHTYRFKVYALDNIIDLRKGATLSELETAMGGHILAVSELDGRYQN